jgi:hypothetical protein
MAISSVRVGADLAPSPRIDVTTKIAADQQTARFDETNTHVRHSFFGKYFVSV